MSREKQIQKNAETRQAIIDTAIAIGLEQNFEEVSIRKITDRLGYSPGIIYHYFKDKQEILDTIHKQSSMELKRSVESCIRSEYNFEKNIKLVFKMLIELSINSPEIIRKILLDKYSFQSETIAIWLEMISHCIDIAVKSNELRPINSRLTAYILLNSFLVAEMTIKENHLDKNKIEDILNTELDIVLHGVLN